MITITINEGARHFPHSDSLAAILAQCGLEQSQGIAVALNDEVIPKKNWDGIRVYDQDRILIITATAGG